MSTESIALATAGVGWPVLPLAWLANGHCSCDAGAACRTPGKHPYGVLAPHGLTNATTDAAAIRSWWTRWNQCNLGVVTGAASGLVVLDVDPRHGGDATLADLERTHGALPDTPRVATGGGGLHIYFRHPGDAPIKSGSDALGPGLDIKADGGYVVAPPSGHASGTPYRWLRRPKDVAPAPLPDWLLERLRAAGRRLAAADPIDETIPAGTRNHTLTSLAGSMRRRGMTADEITEALRSVNTRRCQPPLAEEEVEAIAVSVSRYAPATNGHGHGGASAGAPATEPPHAGDAPAAGLPVIDVTNYDLPSAAAEAWAALEQANDPPTLFRRDAGLVRIDADDAGRPVLVPLELYRLRHALARAADWVRVAEPGPHPTRPPLDLVRDLLADPEPALPRLRRLVTVPTFAADGRLVATPGYDEPSRLFLACAPGLVVPEIPDRPTAEEVAAARAALLEPLTDFPFAADADRAHALSIIFTTLARDLIDGPTPNHLAEAPTPGTGKSLLTDVLATIALGGGRYADIAQPSDEEEWRKALSTYIEQGHALIRIDNVKGDLASGHFAKALTEPTWDDRRLGSNDLLRAPVLCTWITTANNPVLSREILRRSIRIRLLPVTDTPWRQDPATFRHPDLAAWVRAERGRLLAAGLTLVQAWLAAGRPPWPGTPLGRFEAWSRTVGGILDVAGVPGFLTNLDAFYEAADLERETWRAFVATWAERFGTTECSVSDLVPIARETDGLALKGETDRGHATSLGRLLTARVDQVVGDYRLARRTGGKHGARWRLLPVGEPRGTSGGLL